MNALPPQCLSTEAALDWLLFELSKDQLPKQYAEEIQTTGGVELKQYARKERELKQTPESQLSEAEEAEERAAAAQAAAAAKAAAEKAAARQAQERAEAEEKEKAARRAWILQYAAESEDEDDSGSEASAASETSSIEDWEVWGDAREIERRKAERKRTSLPREKRLALISEELAGAKARAAKAKASGDKGGQRAVGQIIGQLKREMAELGITEEDLPSVMEEGIGGEEAGAAPSNGVFGEEPDAFGEPAESPHAEEATAENGGKGGADGNSDAEDMPPSFDLFGDGGDAAALESVPGSAKRKAAAARAAAAAALKPWGDSSGGKGGGKAKGGGKGAPKPPEAQQPKALLQQACQRRGWGAPRYEKLTPGGDREPSGTGLRYSVVIDLGKAPGPKRKGARGAHAGPQKFVLPEGLDGWQRIEEAQNAAAVLALLCLCGNEDSEMWQRLAPPFDELWLECLDGGVGAVVEETEEEGAARDAFIAALVETKLAEASQQARRSKSAGAEAERFNGASWEANLAESLHKHKEAKDGAASRATSERLLHLLREFRDSKEGADWQAVRAKLPAAALRSQLQEALDQHDVVIVSGETGSGKTTQVPQFILEGATEAMAGGATNIVCTQPRRIAAISVAERVACERGEPAPGERGSVVGYSVRLDSATTADTRLLFCTTGVLLRRLIGDPALATVSHVIVDEVHERTMQGDFLVALLRELVAQRREAHAPLKVILMSATLDAGLLADYFGGCPVLHALGRTFPVQQFYLEDVYEATGYVLAADAPVALRPGGCYRRQQRRLENAVGARNRAAVRSGWGDGEADGPPLNPHYDADLYEEFSAGTRRNLGRVDEDRIDFDLIEELVSMVHETQGEGAILIFLPGMGEIANLQRRLEAIRELRGHWIIPLHSAVAPADQRKAFKRPPKGLRKIVLATNIAETSVTVEDVRFVIDTGRLKERRHDASRSMSLLVEDWASVAAVKQRKGRAGRTQEGICYALYTRHRFEHQMKKFQVRNLLQQSPSGRHRTMQ